MLLARQLNCLWVNLPKMVPHIKTVSSYDIINLIQRVINKELQ